MTGTAINSVQLEQDHDWRPRRARLWGNHAPRRPVLVTLPPPPPPKPEPKHGAPIDFYAPYGVKFLCSLVAAKHGMTYADLMGSKRTRRYTGARHEAWCVIRNHTAKSLPEMGVLFDRHHTSILHGIALHYAAISGKLGGKKIENAESRARIIAEIIRLRLEEKISYDEIGRRVKMSSFFARKVVMKNIGPTPAAPSSRVYPKAATHE